MGSGIFSFLRSDFDLTILATTIDTKCQGYKTFFFTDDGLKKLFQT